MIPAFLVVAIAIGAVWFSTIRRAQPRPAAVHPADSLDAQSAFRAGGRLGTAGHHAASVPYFRRAVAAGMGQMWEGRFNLAAALINSALEVEPRFGRVDPALRSSFERVQSVFDGMSEARQAAQFARTPRMRAYTAYQDATMLQFWGLPWDALTTARTAASLDPDWEAPRRLIQEIERDLANGGRQ